MAENYRFGLPIAASTYASQIDLSLNIIHIGMVVIFVFWAILFVYILFRFRKGRNPAADYNVKKWPVRSFLPDAAILVFELLVIFMWGLPIWSQVKEAFPPTAQSNVVEMMAEQFAWGFQYAGPDGMFGGRDAKQINSGNTIGIDFNDPASKDDIISLNELHIPLGKPTILYTTSKDVIHSFFVPEFRIKQDVVPGMRIPIWFEPTKTGTFELVCAQLCGLGHYRMMGTVVVHTPEDFENKLKEIKAQ